MMYIYFKILKVFLSYWLFSTQLGIQMNYDFSLYENTSVLWKFTNALIEYIWTTEVYIVDEISIYVLLSGIFSLLVFLKYFVSFFFFLLVLKVWFYLLDILGWYSNILFFSLFPVIFVFSCFLEKFLYFYSLKVYS